MTVDLPGGFVVGDDYVPTTDEVRFVFSYTATRTEGEFDRWLSAHDGAIREQIAAQIEAELYTHEDECPEGSCPECSIVFAAAEIARGRS